MIIEHFELRAQQVIKERARTRPDLQAKIEDNFDEGPEGTLQSTYHLATIREVFARSANFEHPSPPDAKKGFTNAVQAVDVINLAYFAAVSLRYNGWTAGRVYDPGWKDSMTEKIKREFPEAEIDLDTVEGVLIADANHIYASDVMFVRSRINSPGGPQ